MASALLTDLYEFTMVDAYLAEGLHDEAAFSLFVRRLPARRNFLLASGLEDALTWLESLRFSAEELAWLESLGRFSPRLLDWLEHFHFTGDVHAVPEGTPVFAEEPLLEVVAPLPEAQLVETYLINQMHLQTLAASKAARVVEAARGRPVVDFGVRRMHGEDAGLKVARAAYVAGVSATSNMQAGQRYGIPVSGTLAHSYIQAHDDELAAFRAYVRRFPETTLLVDTYDTLEGVRKVVELARELGPDFRVHAVRLDSGDLVSLAHSTRWLLDAAGLERVQIFASGGLDEDEVDMLLAHHAPIDGFGVGTAMGVSADVPALDMAYKLVEYAGRGRLKLSTGKALLPGRKQVFREEEDGVARRDVLARHGEVLPGRPLLRQVMHAGTRLEGASPSLEAIRAHAREELARLPLEVTRLEPARPPYPVDVSRALNEAREQIVAQLREELHAP
ncbi:nicotinate phosphoribosyltransferase [Vitiosangium sp. GDMCC 1.1324]|uniref:nicotinate phosphoribosyltransferase n=1 Tax=Vitiosangium sp. (strain GDMCC 1.1324) TaxID=2138576 RepID=UPI000D33E6F2|nr:nicotinate phosphoribosyltransferase [Vitiosangium sp. GDMCC 1.1324]PTL83434.1 nicotinate phosphoribosyltransferase [Vitiosangium sp. GDMCC 1.1324]